jgi:Xaa-Pro aminopeptidase
MVSMRIHMVVVLTMAVVLATVAQDIRYLEYDTDLTSPASHRERREKLMAEIGEDAAAIFYSAPVRNRNGDVDYQYRQDDNFYYLTGFKEPNAILMLVPKGVAVADPQDTTRRITVKEILLVQPRNALRETWTGRRYGPEGAMKLRGLQYATTNDQLQTLYSRMMFTVRPSVLYLPPFPSDFSGEIAELMRPVINSIDNMKTRHSQVELRDPSPRVYRMRAIKSKEEIALLTKATQISVVAHNQAMMSCEPGMYEYELSAIYEYVFRKMGAEYAGYNNIVGSAENSIILHYDSNRRQIKDGDIVLADCAAEYRGYSSDVTRTWPANGKFTPAQRAIYQIVLDAQNAAIAMMKPGVAWNDVSATVEGIVEEGLFKLGLVKEKNRREFRKFYLHGIGHPVGLNVHDVSLPILEAGMVYTIEPGIYIGEVEGVDSKYHNIGVRIEDVVLITETGSQLLSSDSPREISAIEALMKKKGIGNQPLK